MDKTLWNVSLLYSPPEAAEGPLQPTLGKTHMKQNHTKVFEWSVWANLDKESNIELILLKGYLILEIFIENLLSNGGLENHVKSSFFKKVNTLSLLHDCNLENIEEVKHHLLALNKIRNQFAHEWGFCISESNLEYWAHEVASTFEGEKFSKYTYRTKIIHAFSALSGALVEIQQ